MTEDPQPEGRLSKGPWILVGIVLVIQIIVWVVFITFAERTKPESVPLEAPAVPAGRAADGS